jgi:hypothetical protein
VKEQKEIDTMNAQEIHDEMFREVVLTNEWNKYYLQVVRKTISALENLDFDGFVPTDNLQTMADHLEKNINKASIWCDLMAKELYGDYTRRLVDEVNTGDTHMKSWHIPGVGVENEYYDEHGALQEVLAFPNPHQVMENANTK